MEQMDICQEPRLYMVELEVSLWSETFAWLRDVVDVPLVWVDVPNQFALFQAIGAKIAIKARALDSALSPRQLQLAFETPELDAIVDRLRAKGQAFDGPLDHDDEGYRRLRVVGPDGLTAIWFQWTRTQVKDAIEQASQGHPS